MTIKFKSLFSFKQKEVEKAFSHAKFKASLPGLKLLQTDALAPSHGKLLIVASRKVGKASKRNRIRRQIREFFFKNKLYEKPVTSILIVYKEVFDLSQEKIANFLKDNLWQK